MTEKLATKTPEKISTETLLKALLSDKTLGSDFDTDEEILPITAETWGKAQEILNNQ
jgi:hypothetical protein